MERFVEDMANRRYAHAKVQQSNGPEPTFNGSRDEDENYTPLPFLGFEKGRPKRKRFWRKS